MTSELILDFQETGDLRTLRINDSSFYNPKIKVENAILEVTPPGYLEPVKFNVKDHFSIVLNSSNLKLAKVNVYRDLKDLSDGIYEIKYSINPNNKLWVEYDHFRTSALYRSYYEKLAKLKLDPYPLSLENQKHLKKLREAEVFLKAAKVEVEYSNNRSRGLDLYNYAKELINDTCKHC